MYDENAQDECTITVIATGLNDKGVNTPVAKAMKDFSNPYKKQPAKAPASANEAAATANQARPAGNYTAPTYTVPTGYGAGAGQYTAPQQQGTRPAGTAPAANPNPTGYRPNAGVQINVPDFLRKGRDNNRR